MKRGQVAIEFLVLSGFMIFVFSMFFLVVQQRASVVAEQGIIDEVTRVTDIIDSEITLARRVHPGYQRSFKIPILISGEPYTITLVPQQAPSEVIITYAGGKEYVLFLDVNLSSDSSLAAGENIITKPTADNVTVKRISDVGNVCQSGQTNIGWIAGGSDLWGVTDGLVWDSLTQARTRINTVNMQSVPLACCDLNQCPSSENNCYTTGWFDTLTLNWTCFDRGQGSTFFSCSSGNDGQLADGSAGTLCCSRFSADPDSSGPVNIGDYGFQYKNDLSKVEVCGDGSDNDCDVSTSDTC